MIFYTNTSKNIQIFHYKNFKLILKDRKKEFIEDKKAVCQDGCDFSNYDYKYKKAQCSCDVKESSDKYEDMKIIKEKSPKNFKEKKK